MILEIKFFSKTYQKEYYYNPITDITSWEPFNFSEENIRFIKNAYKYKPYVYTYYPVPSKTYGHSYFIDGLDQYKDGQWKIPRILINRVLSVNIPKQFLSSFENIQQNHNVIMEWLNLHLPLAIDLDYLHPMEITLISNTPKTPKEMSDFLRFGPIVQVKVAIYDSPSPENIEIFLENLRNPDSNSNYPIWVNEKGKLSLTKPVDELGSSSLITLTYLKVPVRE